MGKLKFVVPPTFLHLFLVPKAPQTWGIKPQVKDRFPLCPLCYWAGFFLTCPLLPSFSQQGVYRRSVLRFPPSWPVSVQPSVFTKLPPPLVCPVSWGVRDVFFFKTPFICPSGPPSPSESLRHLVLFLIGPVKAPPDLGLFSRPFRHLPPWFGIGTGELVVLADFNAEPSPPNTEPFSDLFHLYLSPQPF